MTRRMTEGERRDRRENRCGGYLVELVGEPNDVRIKVTCATCGPTAHHYTPAEARLLADHVTGAHGRNQVNAPNAVRERLGGMLRKAADAIESMLHALTVIGPVHWWCSRCGRFGMADGAQLYEVMRQHGALDEYEHIISYHSPFGCHSCSTGRAIGGAPTLVAESVPKTQPPPAIATAPLARSIRKTRGDHRSPTIALSSSLVGVVVARDAHGIGRAVNLRSGGSITFTSTVDLFNLSPADRAFIESIVALLDEYEKCPTAAGEAVL